MRIAIAHEWLTNYAGSERCVEELLGEFPGARLLTTVVRLEAVPPPLARAEPSFLQHIPGASRRHQALLPLMPLTWRVRDPVEDVEAVVSSTHACAKGVRVADGIPHVAYCHTPMRYAWEYELERDRFPASLRPVAGALMAGFRHWDRRTVPRVTRFVANSREVAGRIRRFYGRRADVVPPPVRTGWFTPGASGRGDFFLYVGRFVAYKRADLVVDAFRDLPFRLVMVGCGPMEESLRASAPPNVEFAGRVDDARLRELMRSARAFVYPVVEDFGIVMAEALACGTPVIGLDQGGARDIVDDGETGWLIPRAEVGLLRDAVRRAAAHEPDADGIAERAERFSSDNYRRRMREVVEETVCAPGRSW